MKINENERRALAEDVTEELAHNFEKYSDTGKQAMILVGAGLFHELNKDHVDAYIKDSVRIRGGNKDYGAFLRDEGTEITPILDKIAKNLGFNNLKHAFDLTISDLEKSSKSTTHQDKANQASQSKDTGQHR